ncbi:cation:proton antiporter [Streptomyces sp. NPDC003522]
MSQSVSLALARDPNLNLILKVLPAIVLILAASALCGRLAVAVRQPRVVGEMVAGVLLGPTLFGALFPGAQEAVFAPEVKPVLYVLSTIGLTLFMFLVGVGLDHGTHGNRELGRNSAVLAVSGIVPALALGAGVGFLLHGRLSRGDVSPVEFAFFVGGALSVTAFPMLARILYEQGRQNTHLGRLALLGASIDDAAAWCFLALLTALHSGAPTDALVTIGFSIVFVIVMLTAVRRLLRPLGTHVARTGSLSFDHMYIVVGVALLAGYVTDYIGIYSVFGGFIAGVAMPRDAAFREAVHGRMMDLVCVFLLPIFFTYSGLNTELNGLAGWSMAVPFLLILLAGFAGKYFGCGLAMRALGFSSRESYAIGALMNARGLMILIFINIGLAQGLINREVFSMLVLVAVITTAAAVPLFRRALPDPVPAPPAPESAAEEGKSVRAVP